MQNQKFPRNPDGALAEKCRIALEKSWGVDIPVPKSWKKQKKRNNLR